MEIGQFIKEKREAAGLSMKKLGESCGVSDSEILKIENGTRVTPNWVILCKISKVLSFNPVQLLVDTGNINIQDIEPSYKINGLSSLNEDEIEEVQKFVDFLLYRRG